MDFFKSVFATDPDADIFPSDSSRKKKSAPDDEDERGGEAPAADCPNSNSPSTTGGGGAWGFGGLIKTIAAKKEFGSLIETYRRDLAEFGSGLKKETAAIREAATRAVRDLPGSLEAGVSVAQESLESFGQAIDDLGGSVWRGTIEIISQGKETLLATESDANFSDLSSIHSGTQNPTGTLRRYVRLEAQVLAIQSDPSTFLEEVEDAEDFKQWSLGFQLAEKEEEIENLCYENGVLEEFLERLVPAVVDYDTFWSRYYYRVHKLKQAEDAAKLVKRVISREENEEDLSWEVDDDEEEEGEKGVDYDTFWSRYYYRVHKLKQAEEKKPVENLGVGGIAVWNNEELSSKADDNAVPEAKTETGSCKDSDSDVSVVSRPSMTEEDDLEWDEIEDLGEHDDKEVHSLNGSPRIMDLNWDIEDDDDLVKL